MNRTRDIFKPQSLLGQCKEYFTQTLQDSTPRRKAKFSLTDIAMSGLAIFHLKYKSLLQFDHDRLTEPNIRHNLTTLYQIKEAPCDTYMRERLDNVPQADIQGSLKPIIMTLQRSKVLEEWKYLDGKYLIPLDGTGFFTSNEVHCPHCTQKVHNKGKKNEYTSYHHNMLVGTIASPATRQVLPLLYEPIVNADGATKNDCELNAGKRWLSEFRHLYPQLPSIIVGDALYTNGHFIQELAKNRCSYILGVTDKGHKNLLDYFWAGEAPDIGEYKTKSKDKTRTVSYRWMKDVPLNDTHPDILVTVVYVKETDAKGNIVYRGSWVTDLKVEVNNICQFVRAARCRWKIENETFNTLKNQGYNFEHNYGHGNSYLSNNLAGLMLLSFLIDQVLITTNLEFREALEKWKSKCHLWEKIRSKFFEFFVMSWDALYKALVRAPPVFLVD
jgi:Transposase DDE domain